MVDAGVRETDRIIAEIEARIKVEYAQAQREIEKKLGDYMDAYALKDKKWQEWVRDGKKTEDEYKEWKTGQIAAGERWEQMRDTIAQDLLNANKMAKEIAAGAVPEVYALNHDYGTYQVETASQMDTSYTLYNRSTAARIFRDNPQMLPAPGKKVSKDIADGKALRWNNKHIQSVMLQALLQGNPIPDIATRLANVVGDSDRKAATRNARTMMTGAQNAGRIDSYRRAESMGIKTRKQWLATLDRRTRHEHRELDGQIADNDKPFVVEGMKIRYPGDPEADPSLVWNCRCTLIASIAGFERDLSDTSLRHNRHLGKMSYDEWKADKTEKSRDILIQEKTSNRNRAEYIREYRENPNSFVAPGWDKTLTIDALKSGPQYAEGRDIFEGWTWDKDKWAFPIEQAIHDQGFDGLPQVVDRETFDEMVRQSGMIAQRVYTAPDQETLDLYRDSLLHGKWYVDCSEGGCSEGQGMYCAADYTGTLSDGIKTEMQGYIGMGEFRIRNAAKEKILSEITPEEMGVTGDDVRIIKDGLRDIYDGRMGRPGTRLNYSEEKRLRELKDVYKSVESLNESKTDEYMESHPVVHKIETLTLAPGANIITFDDLNDKMKAEGYCGDKYDVDLRWGKYQFMDAGVYASLHGYDAINAEGHGHSGSYTVILNRTKTYILEE